MTIGRQLYNGGTGPSNVAVTAGETFSWTSDHSITRSGCTICYAPPNIMEVTAGPQYYTANANGVTDRAGDYGNGERCTIRVAAAGRLTATSFSTEASYDYVTVGGRRSSGSSGPVRV